MLNNEKRYLISRFVNLIGNSIYNICIPLYLLEKFESLMITGAFFTLVQIPMVVLLPFIGSYLKNKNLKHTMLASNVISVVIFMMVFINEQFFLSSFILFMILTMLEKINVAIFNISSQSAFPILFEKTDIDEINSLKSVLDNFAALLGPTLGTVIYSKGGFSAVVGINILSFALCFLMLLHLKYIDKCGLSIQKKNKVKDIYEGLIYIKSNSNIMLLFLTFMILNFLVAPTENVFAPAIIKVIYKFSDSLFGLTSTAVSIGVIAAGTYMSIFKKKSNILYAFYTQSIIMILTGILSLFLRGQPMIFFTIYIILCLLSGYSSTLVIVTLFIIMSIFQGHILSSWLLYVCCASLMSINNISYNSCLQKSIEDTNRGTILSLRSLLIAVTGMLISPLVGHFSDIYGFSTTFLCCGIICLSLLFITSILAKKI